MNERLLDPATYCAVRRPLLEAEALPPACYTSPEFFALERERIFMKVWNFVGDVGLVPNPGDYHAFDYAGVPVLLVRDRAGTVRAFANTCRHKGSRIVSGDGSARAFKCPYHGWVYGLDGKLTGAPQMEHSKGFDRAEYGLVPVRLERLGIFLFICFDSAAPGLGQYLADFPELVASHNLDDLVCARRLQLDVPANWKVATENMFEGYHVPVVHGQSLGRNDYSEGMSIINGKSNELFGADPGGPVRLWFRDSVSVMISRHPGSNALIAGARGFPPIESLEGVAREGSLYSFIYPSTFFPCNIDCVWYVTFFPVAAARSTLLIGQCFPASTVERADFPDVIENYHKRLDLSIAEDLAIMKEQQAGLASPFARAGRLCHHEAFVHHYRNWVVDRVLGTSTQGAPRGA